MHQPASRNVYLHVHPSYMHSNVEKICDDYGEKWLVIKQAKFRQGFSMTIHHYWILHVFLGTSIATNNEHTFLSFIHQTPEPTPTPATFLAPKSTSFLLWMSSTWIFCSIMGLIRTRGIDKDLPNSWGLVDSHKGSSLSFVLFSMVQVRKKFGNMFGCNGVFW